MNTHSFSFARLLCLILIIGDTSTLPAQSTFGDVHALFTAKCTATCHEGGSPAGNLDLSGSISDVYSRLIETTPTNPAAAAKGYKTVDPGFPANSFLLRKLARSDWDAYYPLDEPAEGEPMPKTGFMADEEIELVRQWILFGAPLGGSVVDTDVLDDFYNGKGKKKVDQPAAPPAGEGFQVRLGSFFLGPLEEREYFKKFPVSTPEELEVTRLEIFFNEESHHFIMYKFEPGQAAFYADGMRNLEDFGGSSMTSTTMVAAWQDADERDLPPGTAWFWEEDPVLDLNYHLANFETDSVLACDVYINVYTRPRQASTVEMFSLLLPIDALSVLIFGTGEIGESLVIPNDGLEHEFTEDFYIPLSPDPIWYLWLLSSHTHARGTDYDIFTRGVGTEQIFEGFFNTDYTFNQGFYDWEHPPVRLFDPLYEVNMGFFGGLKQVAKYVNNTADTLRWGDTTKDEMMLIFVQYTEEPLPASPAGNGPDDPTAALGAYPNPMRDAGTLWYDLPQAGSVSIALQDVLGRTRGMLFQGQQTAGRHRISLDAQQLGLESGVYLVNLEQGGNSSSTRIIIR